MALLIRKHKSLVNLDVLKWRFTVVMLYAILVILFCGVTLIFVKFGLSVFKLPV